MSTGTSTSPDTGIGGPCGDGVVDKAAGEACDPADDASGPKCTSVCTVLDVVDIAGGAAHTCALLAGGLVKCWGFNANGELGLSAPVEAVGDNPGEMGAALKAVDLGKGQAAFKLAVGTSHACAQLVGGTLKCWGLNSSGQLGLGDLVSRGDNPGEMGDALPLVDLGVEQAVVQIAAGSQHTCALLKNGNVKCWGKNEHGQLGMGEITTLVLGDGPGEMGDNLPIAASGVIQIAAGDFHTCGLFDDGAVKCWGYNHLGQLGQGDTMDRGTVEKIPPIALGASATLIWARGSQSCALLETGVMKCWGDNTYGQLGLLDLAPFGDDPAEISFFPDVSLDSAPKKPPEWGMGREHTCGVFPAFGVKCWGHNNHGQLGTGLAIPNTTQPPSKTEVADIGLGAVTVVGSGAFHACAWAPASGLRCWGRNHTGQLGVGNVESYGLDPSGLGPALPAVKLVSATW